MDDESHSDAAPSLLTLYFIAQYNPQRYISIAVFDQKRRMFMTSSFADNQHYTNLESLLIQLDSKEEDEKFEIILSLRTDITSQISKIKGKLQNFDYKNDKNNGKYSDHELSLALTNLLQKQLSYYDKEMKDKKAMEALEKLLKNLCLEKDITNKEQFTLQSFKFDNFMKLDQPAINALLIFPKEMDKKIISGTNTIFELLNNCKTHIGTRCLKRWMRQPLQNQQELEQRLDKVQFFLRDPVTRNSIQNDLKKLPDLDSLYYIFYKVQSGKRNNVEVNDLIKIYRTVQIIKDLIQSLMQKDLSKTPINQTIENVEKNIKILSNVCKMIQDNIIMEGRDNEFHVRPDAQQELSVISREQIKTSAKINEHIKQVEADLGVQVSKLVSSVHKWVLEADKKKSIDRIKDQEGYQYLTAKQNKITFTTDTLTDLCKTLMYLEEEYKEKEKDILKKMYKVVAGYYPIMEELSKILSELDVVTTFSNFINSAGGVNTPWIRPTFADSVSGTNLHHPCVKSCIANDCDLSTHKTVVLTGPNMGGKSTFIRTVGLAVYLAHIGCYVPASSFHTSIIDTIITRVGASDMQIRGVSTFMSEMIESSTMLRSATSKSLVLIDELGRGTSTSEGFGIAWAICLELHKKINPFCLFATHFHEMTRMADSVEGVKNMYTSCRFEEDQLMLEYKVVNGKMEKSYGIQVAKMLRFPEKIIKNAQNYLSLYQNQEQMFGKQKNEDERDKPALTKEENEALSLFKKMKFEIKNTEDEGEEEAIREKYRQQIKAILGK